MLKNKFVFLLSVGRSGSTWLARDISEQLGYKNIGENRYFWERLASQPCSEKRLLMLSDFLNRKGVGESGVLDKSTNLYMHTDLLEDLGLDYQLIFLLRNEVSIERSKEQFVKQIFKPKRILMRIKKYYADYGWRFFIPILQRWRFILIPFGMKPSKAFNTIEVLGGGDAQKMESENFLSVVNSHANHSVILDYDNFHESVIGLKEIGFSDSAIDALVKKFK